MQLANLGDDDWLTAPEVARLSPEMFGRRVRYDNLLHRVRKGFELGEPGVRQVHERVRSYYQATLAWWLHNLATDPPKPVGRPPLPRESKADNVPRRPRGRPRKYS